jgi:hypothetical protein
VPFPLLKIIKRAPAPLAQKRGSAGIGEGCKSNKSNIGDILIKILIAARYKKYNLQMPNYEKVYEYIKLTKTSSKIRTFIIYKII